MTSLFKSIDYRSGIVIFIEDALLENLSIEHQIALLREDLLQVDYDFGRFILDVGWYPSFEQNGEFAVIIVENYDWSKAVYKRHVKHLKELLHIIQEAIDFIEMRRLERF